MNRAGGNVAGWEFANGVDAVGEPGARVLAGPEGGAGALEFGRDGVNGIYLQCGVVVEDGGRCWCWECECYGEGDGVHQKKEVLVNHRS